MSAPDQGDDKGFLARWSQRKQEARQPERDAPVTDSGVTAGPATEAEAPQEFDLSSLPSLDELTAETDITAFLRKGVPEHLRNAALRKSWALDPAIRNYVNPALDYAYDWNTPGGVPGSSELGAGMDVARLVSQIMGTDETAVEPSVPPAESRGREGGHARAIRRAKPGPAGSTAETERPAGFDGSGYGERGAGARHRGRQKGRFQRFQFCCTAASGATPRLGKTRCLDKSF